MNPKGVTLTFFALALVIYLAIGVVSAQELIWKNDNVYTVYNNPENPTEVSFHDCVKMKSITNYHWNNGKGDIPGFITLYDESGVKYGPWPTTGRDGMYNAPNAYWIAEPDLTLWPGRYWVEDSSPETWAHNDENGNEGMVTIVYEIVPCPIIKTETKKPTPGPTSVVFPPDALVVKQGEFSLDGYTGGATETKTSPKIEQVSCDILFDELDGGENIYLTLTLKNVGDRALEYGLLSISFRNWGLSGSNIPVGGYIEIPAIAVGETREIPLIIPIPAMTIDKYNTPHGVDCVKCNAEGTVSEIRKDGTTELVGHIYCDEKIEFTGCCCEYGSAYGKRDCTPKFDPVLGKWVNK